MYRLSIMITAVGDGTLREVTAVNGILACFALPRMLLNIFASAAPDVPSQLCPTPRFVRC